ncbi:Uncharacterised protein [Clostridium perfringens]|uniref:Uncharacterized protein n=1 Tax=Clostridium perfringens TaxID=1502 RepID=A0A2X3IRZ4_CLOPF|nr:Uncharacterised protein [Clostridium perfringens]
MKKKILILNLDNDSLSVEIDEIVIRKRIRILK